MSNETDNQDNKERIAKVMARAGLCSRRDAERWIAEARVEVNGKLLTTPATLVSPDDAIKVDGKLLNTETETLLWRYYKPDGLVTSHKDPEERPTVFDNLPHFLPRVVSVGRLDLTSEGLLLLTNDGTLARHLEHPSTGWVRRYRVRAYGRVSQEQLDRLAQGVTVDGVRYGPIEAEIDRVTGGNVWLTVGLTEGKNREIRRVLSSLDLTVNRLIRMSYGPFQLGRLKPGDVEQVPRRVLFDQLGLKKGDDLGKFLTDQNKAPRPIPDPNPEPGPRPEKRSMPALKAGSTDTMSTDDNNPADDKVVIKPRQAKKTLPRKEKVRHVKASSLYERRALRRNRREDEEDRDNPDRPRHSRYRDHRDPPAKRRSDDSRAGSPRSTDRDAKPGFKGKRSEGDDRPGFKGRRDGDKRGTFKGKSSGGGYKGKRDGEGKSDGFRGKRDGDDRGGFKGNRSGGGKPRSGGPNRGGRPGGPGKGPARGAGRGGPNRGGPGRGPNKGSRGR